MSPKGDFDGSSACELANLIYEQHDGMALVVIDTRHLGEMCPFWVQYFFKLSSSHRLAVRKAFVSGGKRDTIWLPREAVSLVSPRTKHQCRCNGKCTSAACVLKKIINQDVFDPPAHMTKIEKTGGRHEDITSDKPGFHQALSTAERLYPGKTDDSADWNCTFSMSFVNSAPPMRWRQRIKSHAENTTDAFWMGWP